MKITEEMKIKLFKKVLWLEHMSEEKTDDRRDYFSEAEGAFAMLIVLGLGGEYINWAFGK